MFLLLQSSLPSTYLYHICRAELLQNGYYALFRVNILNIEDLEVWLAQYMETSKITYRVSSAKSIQRPRLNLYKKYFRCQHNLNRQSDKAKTQRSKNTNCTATMTVTLRKLPGRYSKYDVMKYHAF